MHYLYFVEGRLKYETINFDSTVVFNLYNKNVDRKNDNVSSDDHIYFLKSDVDVVVTVNIGNNTISLSAPLAQPILLFDKLGGLREVSAEREISLAGDVVKFKIADSDFAFLINSTVDPDKKKLGASGLGGKSPVSLLESNKYQFGPFDLSDKKTLAAIAAVFVLVAVIVGGLLNKKELPPVDSYVAPAIIFNNESELRRADLQDLNSSEILVKTQLLDQIKVYLDQQGYQYVKYELEKLKNGKFNLMLHAFVGKNQNFDVIANHFPWVESVIVQILDTRSMFDDFNKLALKYGFAGIDRNKTSMHHQLVEVSFVNNNLKFESLQRDLYAFYERWGKNYIEFNVSLQKQSVESPFDFILKGGKEAVVKSDKGFFIN